MPSDADLTLIDTWTSIIDSIVSIAQDTPADSWRRSTRLSGWSVADVVAHVSDIESILAGETRPEHEPDWSTLAHVDNPVSRFTEVGVDWRRPWEQAEVVAELRTLRDRRREQLLTTPAGQDVLSATGKPQPMQRLLSMRCFDLWVHDDDLRAALGLDLDVDSIGLQAALEAGLGLAERSWLAQDPSRGSLTIELTDAAPSEAVALGGNGAALTLRGTRREVLELLAGRTDVDPQWACLVVAP